MDLRDSFPIDEPPVHVPWSVSASELQRLLGPALQPTSDRYLWAPVRVLGDLRCNVGFCLNGWRGGLSKLEFFRDAPMELEASFDDFQRRFELAFGPPSSREAGSEGFPALRWMLTGIEISHHVFSRFGRQEVLFIRRFGAA